MDLVYWLFAEYTMTMLLAWCLIPLATLFGSFVMSVRGKMMAAALLFVAGVASFIVGMIGGRDNSNPYILAQDVQPYEISKLAEIRREYPEIDPLMRKAASDGRITNAEFNELTGGKAINEIRRKAGEARETLDRQAVIDGIPPIPTRTSEKRK